MIIAFMPSSVSEVRHLQAISEPKDMHEAASEK